MRVLLKQNLASQTPFHFVGLLLADSNITERLPGLEDGIYLNGKYNDKPTQTYFIFDNRKTFDQFERTVQERLRVLRKYEVDILKVESMSTK